MKQYTNENGTVSKAQAGLVIITGMVWMAIGVAFLLRISPLDFYGDGVWFAQSALRWFHWGWPTTSMASPVHETIGWGIFTPWLYIGILGAFLELFGTSLPSAASLSLVAGSLAAIFTGLLLARYSRSSWSFMIFYILMLLNPMFISMAHDVRPEAMITLWISSFVLLVLSKKETLRLIAWLILPVGFWIHPVCGLMTATTWLILGIVSFKNRHLRKDFLWLTVSSGIILCLSFIIAWSSNKLDIMSLITTHYADISPKRRVLPLLYVLIPSIVFYVITWLTLRDNKAINKNQRLILVVLLISLMLLPMILSMRPRRIYQFTLPLLYLMLYVYYFYIKERWGKNLSLGFIGVLIILTGLYWYRTKIPYYFKANPILIKKAQELYSRNASSIQAASTMGMRFKGDGYFFWLLPKEKQLFVRRFSYKPMENAVATAAGDSAIQVKDMPIVDSINLGIRYDNYGARGFSKFYLYSSVASDSGP